MADLRGYQKHQQKSNKPAKKQLSKEERRALVLIKQEAKKAKAVLHSDGEGGLAPSLVLYVMRRDGYKCKIHGDRGEGKHEGLEVHHVGGIENPSKRLLAKGHLNLPDNIVTLCHLAHGELHDRDRKLTEEKSKGEAPPDEALGDTE